MDQKDLELRARTEKVVIDEENIAQKKVQLYRNLDKLNKKVLQVSNEKREIEKREVKVEGQMKIIEEKLRKQIETAFQRIDKVVEKEYSKSPIKTLLDHRVEKADMATKLAIQKIHKLNSQTLTLQAMTNHITQKITGKILFSGNEEDPSKSFH